MSEETAKLDLYSRAENAAQTISARANVVPKIALVLGSGLGAFADEFEEPVRIPYQEIPGFVTSTAQGHAGKLVIGKVAVCRCWRCRDACITTKVTPLKKLLFRSELSSCWESKP